LRRLLHSQKYFRPNILVVVPDQIPSVLQIKENFLKKIFFYTYFELCLKLQFEGDDSGTLSISTKRRVEKN